MFNFSTKGVLLHGGIISYVCLEFYWVLVPMDQAFDCVGGGCDVWNYTWKYARWFPHLYQVLVQSSTTEPANASVTQKFTKPLNSKYMGLQRSEKGKGTKKSMKN